MHSATALYAASPPVPLVHQSCRVARSPTRVRSVPFSALHSFADSAPEEQEPPPPRYRPDGLAALAKRTNFSRDELQIIYRGFKQV